jgi:hypothetical protein
MGSFFATKIIIKHVLVVLAMTATPAKSSGALQSAQKLEL